MLSGQNKNKLVLILLCVVVLGLIIAKDYFRKEFSFNKKIIILGFDGLSPEIIEPMMAKGKLPNFSRLKEQGAYRHLSTTIPSISSAAWAGFATGQNPGENGIYDFIKRDPETYRLIFSLLNIEKGNEPKRVLQSKAFWQYTSEKNIPTVIISMPNTYPPDKIYGRMLSGMGVPDILGTQGTFTYYTSESLKGKNIGGRIIQVEKSPEMVMDLIGPRVGLPGSRGEVSKVQFKVIPKGKDRIEIEYLNDKFILEQGQWSDWKDVNFSLGISNSAKGIFKFYLIEVTPEIKLYVSPINFDPRDPLFQISYPEAYSKELVNKIGLYYTKGIPFDTWAVNEGILSEAPFIEQAEEEFREKNAILDVELGRFNKGVLFCYFESSDIIQHMFWRYIDPDHPLYEANAPHKYKEAIENWYMKMDDVLGKVMDTIDNKNDLLIVLSDHGFNTFRREVHLNSWLRKNGYLELKNPGAISGMELLSDIDWDKTKAYAIGFGAVYVNQSGREKNGIVKPGKDTQLLKEEIKHKLQQWIDDKYNMSVVHKVYDGGTIFQGEYDNETPDIYVGFNIGYSASWHTAIGGVPEMTIEDNLYKWSGTHIIDPEIIPGILLLNKTVSKETPSIYDIVPTILTTSGYSDDEIKSMNLDGESLLK